MTRQDSGGERSLQEAYALLNAHSPDELVRAFIRKDQEFLKDGSWDYKNPELITNKVKEAVEDALGKGLWLEKKESRDDLRDILWFWYHHATSQAIWHYSDRVKAKEFSEKALEYQIDENPNKITRLLYLLVRNADEKAAAWLETIATEPDKSAAQKIMTDYQAGNFFKSSFQARPGK